LLDLKIKPRVALDCGFTMKLTVVGCSGLFPSPSSAASSYLVECGGPAGRSQKVLLDLGSGALGPLQRFAAPSEINAIIISNLDFDHLADLSCLYFVVRYPPGEPYSIPIYGPAGTSSRLEGVIGGAWREKGPLVFNVTEFSHQAKLAIGDLTVTPYRVNHPGESYGLRLEDGKSVVAYTSDSDICPALSTLADRADLLLADATFQERRDLVRNIHMTGTRAGIVATRASVGRLVLTHLPVWTTAEIALAEAASSYKGILDIASVGQVYEIP
jgi:ribonuclease BN (tRNA processing enzyme)